MDNRIQKQLQSIFSSMPEVIAAYIIGSFAKGVARGDSDFDLTVIVDHKAPTAIDGIYGSIASVSFPADLDLSVADRSSSPLFLFEVISSGTLVYERSSNDRAAFEAGVLHTYYDTEHMRAIYYSYLRKKFPVPYADTL